MIRIGLYITLAILLALGAVWFADHPGQIQLNWQGWEVRMSMAIFCLAAFFYTLSCWSLFKLYRWFRTDNPLTNPKRMAGRREKGLRELDMGWSALVVHDTAKALKHGKKAYALLPKNNGPRRLLMQAGGDKKYRDQLLTESHTSMVALHFQLTQGDQNVQQCHNILLKMQKLAPDNPWVSQKIFDSLTRLGRWGDAEQALTRLVKSKAVDMGAKKHFAAVLSYCQALEADLAGQKKAARDFAETALKNDPAFLPAALLLGRHHLTEGDKTRAQKIIEKIWKIAPHPDLGPFFLKLAPLESPSEKFRRIQKFTDLNPDHPASLHLRARVALDTEHWTEAKRALDQLVKTKRASRESYHLLARLEILQKQDEVASNAYLTQALTAADDPKWHCAACHTSFENYAATCPKCHAFGQVIWQEEK